MSGFFISYRRTDTLGWAGRVHADLGKRFGNSRVFMDIDGISRGDDLARVLQARLADCDALLVLIGPQWLNCTRSDGRRRLDIPDDWVRTEIASALQRKIPILPVLLGDAKRPQKEDLPGNLEPLCGLLATPMLDHQWDADLRKLFGQLVQLTTAQPKDPSNIASATAGLTVLKDMMLERPAIADSISRSKEVIERTYRGFNRLELFKSIHDALHEVEFLCLRPMEAGSSGDPLFAYGRTFAMQVRQIREALRDPDMDSNLSEEIEIQMELTANAFKAMETLGDAAHREMLLHELNLLLSSFPERLNQQIVTAAKDLNLARLIELMTKVKGMLPALPEDADGTFQPFQPLLQGIGALEGLRDQLKMLVDEHSRLQSLDRELRMGCVGGTAVRNPREEWRRIKVYRARLAPPFSAEVASALDDLIDLEARIDAAVGQADDSRVLQEIRQYFLFVATLFRAVDTSLKRFSKRLGTVSQPLKTILDSC